MRALLEMSGVLTAGFLWYVTQTDIVEDYDVHYSWPVFRKKLTGEAVASTPTTSARTSSAIRSAVRRITSRPAPID